MTDNLGRTADKRFCRHAFYVNRVVRNKAVTALQQLNRRFAFSDSAFTEQQHALAVYLNQNTVPRD